MYFVLKIYIGQTAENVEQIRSATRSALTLFPDMPCEPNRSATARTVKPPPQGEVAQKKSEYRSMPTPLWCTSRRRR